MTAVLLPAPGAARPLSPGAGPAGRVARAAVVCTGRWLTRLLVVTAVVAIAVLAVGPHVLGYQTLTMLTGSMAPAIEPGDVVVTTPLAVTDVTEGMVITYHIPIDDHRLVTHRVVSVDEASDGTVTVRTRGDANRAVDPWYAVLEGDTVHQVRAVVPGAGHLITALRTPWISALLVYGVPLLLAGRILFTIWRPADQQTDPR